MNGLFPSEISLKIHNYAQNCCVHCNKLIGDAVEIPTKPKNLQNKKEKQKVAKEIRKIERYRVTKICQKCHNTFCIDCISIFDNTCVECLTMDIKNYEKFFEMRYQKLKEKYRHKKPAEIRKILKDNELRPYGNRERMINRLFQHDQSKLLSSLTIVERS